MKMVAIRCKARGEDELTTQMVQQHARYGVWAVTASREHLAWMESRDPDKGPRPDHRWTITHVPTGFAVLGGFRAYTKNREEVRKACKELHRLTVGMYGLMNSDHGEVARIPGLKEAVQKALRPLCW